MATNDNVSNIEGLENNTILKTLQNVIKYVRENAVKGDKGDTGSVGPAGPEGKSIVDIQVVSSSVSGENTINNIRVMYNTGETEDFTITCKNGINGAEGPAGPTGSTGVGIASIENKGYSDGTDFTITHIEVTLTNGETESFDVQAQRGATGPVGPAGEPADIQSVTLQSGTQGTIATEDLATLQTSNSNYIIMNNEIYLLMDKQTSSGYLVYSHIGQDSTNNYFVKCITITISTQGWVMTSTQLGGGGGATLKTYRATSFSDLYTKINTLNSNKTPFTLKFTPLQDITATGNYIYYELTGSSSGEDTRTIMRNQFNYYFNLTSYNNYTGQTPYFLLTCANNNSLITLDVREDSIGTYYTQMECTSTRMGILRDYGDITTIATNIIEILYYE